MDSGGRGRLPNAKVSLVCYPYSRLPLDRREVYCGHRRKKLRDQRSVPSVSLTSLRSVYAQAFLPPSPLHPFLFLSSALCSPYYPLRLAVTTPAKGLVVVVPEHSGGYHTFWSWYFCIFLALESTTYYR
jgi:hypothetical protein